MYGISLITHYNGAKAWRVTLFRDGRKVIEKKFPHLTHGREEVALAGGHCAQLVEAAQSLHCKAVARPFGNSFVESSV